MDILGYRKICFITSSILFILSISLFFGLKLNLGIDMTGGTQSEYSYAGETAIDEIQSEITRLSKNILYQDKSVINNVSVYSISAQDSIGITVGYRNDIDEKDLNTLKENFRESIDIYLKTIDPNSSELLYTNIGKSFGDYIKNTAFLTLFLSIIAITFYIAYAFSGVVNGVSIFSFALITIITLFHDVVISSGFYVMVSHFLPQFKIDTYFVTALLTILGYSINDTIVIFDRIRGNLREFGGKPGKAGKTLGQIINLSVTESLKRSIYTSFTLVIVLFTIFTFGPESIGGFILVMIFGTIIGTYSSIFIAAPILYISNRHKTLEIYKKVEINPEDKIVV